MSPAFDWAPYLRTPRLDAPSAIALFKMLRAVRPASLPPLAERAAERLDEAGAALERAWQGSERGGGPKQDARPYDRRLDNLWAAVHARLEALLALPEGVAERARAQALLGAIFAGGLGFLKLRYVAEYAESQRRLDVIESDGLGGEVRELAGAALFEALRAAHDAYGRVLGITEPLGAEAPSRVAELLREVQAALRAYALQLAAYAAAGDEALEAVRVALRPIDEVRALAERRAARGARDAPRGPAARGDADAPRGPAVRGDADAPRALGPKGGDKTRAPRAGGARGAGSGRGEAHAGGAGQGASETRCTPYWPSEQMAASPTISTPLR
ncbi:MAG TPA: hypothetical protein VFS43_34200 [Polyangiaceae bacterium]|nr:hypothetical protein [Polyangiaceae bacterium]